MPTECGRCVNCQSRAGVLSFVEVLEDQDEDETKLEETMAYQLPVVESTADRCKLHRLYEGDERDNF